jgi:hypothetical protein
MEGVAELLATHRWRDQRLSLNYFPADRDDVPEWGRIKIVRDAYGQGAGLSLDEILRYGARAHFQVDAYGWSWAAAAFFDGHPLFQARFRELRGQVRDRSRSFSDGFLSRLPVDQPQLARQWQLFVSQLDYGYDVAREAIEPKPVRELPAGGAQVAIVADRGWQSTGFRLEAERRYRLRAAGRFQLAAQPKIWWCEPAGVTIRYHGGRPLGMLLGAIVDESDQPPGGNGFLTPAGVGQELETSLRRGGTLYLRVNDHPAELADNRGEVTVSIIRLE